MRGGRRLTGDEKHDYEAFIAAENSIVDALVAAKYTLKAALEIVGLSKSSWYYRHHPRRRKRDDGSACHVSPKQLTAAQRKTVASLLVAGKRKHHSVARIFFDHLDGDGEMVASLRTFYRVHAQLRAQNPLAYVPRRRRNTRGVPVVTASGPGQVLCWDITWLPASFMSKGFHLYTVLDLFSRKIVGWTIQPRQVKSVATDLIRAVIKDQRLHGHDVQVVHTDNGGVMTSHSMRTMLDENGVELSLIRPNVSNDNPYEESSHRTLKHHRFALESYRDIAQAEQVVGRIIEAYNHRDRHSGLNYYTPDEVYTGKWKQILAHRRAKEQRYYQAHPPRRPAVSAYTAPPELVGINIGRDLAVNQQV